MVKTETKKIKQQSLLAERLRDARINARLSQSELADHVGVSDKSISAYEKGRSIPPIEKLKKIAELTNHPVSFFTSDSTEEVVIADKLSAIERELIEIRRLLKRTKDS